MMSRLVLFVVSLGALFFCTSRRGISIFIRRAACAPPYDDPQPPFLMNIISLITAFSCPSHFHCALIGRLLRRHMRFSTRTDDRIPREGSAHKFHTLGVACRSAGQNLKLIAMVRHFAWSHIIRPAASRPEIFGGLTASRSIMSNCSRFCIFSKSFWWSDGFCGCMG